MPNLAKLTPPKLVGVRPRRRLFSVLDEISARAAVWICGPPGAGKSALVASYLASKHMPSLWYQVDADDADAASLFHYLGHLAAQSPIYQGEPLPLLTPEYHQDVESFARRFFRTFFGGMTGPCALVFDNYEQVSAETPSHIIFRVAISERPENVGIFVQSRAEPPTLFARLRASRALAEVNWGELRLTTDEATDIASAARGGKPDKYLDLAERCDGWVAGLILLLDHAPAAPPSGIKNSKSHKILFDFFASELFDRLDAATQRLLLLTALLPWVRPEYAESLTEDIGAPARLEELRKRSLFTDFHDTANAYVYHPLFREFLLARQRALCSPEERRDLMRRTARLLVSDGESEHAIRTAIDAGDYEFATTRILDSAQALMQQGRVQTLQKLIGSLPEVALVREPWLIYWRGLCLVHHDIAGAHCDFDRAYAAFDTVGNVTASILAASAAVDAIHFEMNNFTSFDIWVERLSRLLKTPSLSISPDVELNGYTSLLTAALFRGGYHLEFGGLLDRMDALIPTTLDVNAKVRAMTAQVFFLEYFGYANRARQKVDEAEKYLTDPILSPMVKAQFLARRAMLAVIFLGENRNTTLIDDVTDMLETKGITSVLPIFFLAKLLVLQELGDAQGMRATFSRFPEDRLGIGPACWSAGMRGGLAVLENDVETALSWMSRSRALAAETASSAYNLSTLLHSAYAYCIAGQFENAVQAAESVADMFKAQAELRGGCWDPAIPKSYALLRLGRLDEAEGVLRQSLSTWPQEGYCGVPIWTPAVIAPLFAFALERGIETEYLEFLIRHRELAPPSPDTEFWPRAVEIRMLGEFSLKVGGKPIVESRKAPKKLYALLTGIVALGGSDVSEERLCDCIWPDKDGDVARDLLATGLHRLRSLIGDARGIRLHASRLSLEPERVWVDALSFERLANRALASGVGADVALKAYRGPFARHDSATPAVLVTRERLQGKFLQLVAREARRHEVAGEHDANAQMLARAIEAAPDQVTFYDRLESSLNALGRYEEALAISRRRASISHHGLA